MGVQTKGSSCSILLKILLMEDLVLSPFSVRLPEIGKQCTKVFRLNSVLSRGPDWKVQLPADNSICMSCRHVQLKSVQTKLITFPHACSPSSLLPRLKPNQVIYQVLNLEISVLSLLIPHSPRLICCPTLVDLPYCTYCNLFHALRLTPIVLARVILSPGPQQQLSSQPRSRVSGVYPPESQT